VRLIVYNDDLGVTHGLNRAVLELHRAGVTTAAGLRVGGAAFIDAVAAVLPAAPRLEVGLHLDLTEGRPAAGAAAVPALVGRDGTFRLSFSGYLATFGGLGGVGGAGGRGGRLRARLVEQIEIEIAAQLDAAAAVGVAINHLNGHRHVHMVPALFDAVCRVARDRGIGFVRIPREPFHLSPAPADAALGALRLNPLKQLLLARLSRRAFAVAHRHGVGAVGWFAGVLHSGRMTLAAIGAALARLERLGVDAAELLVHPAAVDHPADRALRSRVPGYFFAADRARELGVLAGPGLGELFRRYRVEPTTHAGLTAARAGAPAGDGSRVLRPEVERWAVGG
jgi:predicted glycoside hydrolase/deacetylase ChbG (UPF0249 family)